MRRFLCLLVVLLLSGCVYNYGHDRIIIDRNPFYVALIATHDGVQLSGQPEFVNIEEFRKYKDSYIDRPVMIGHGRETIEQFGIVLYAEIGFDNKTNTKCMVLICQIFNDEIKQKIRNGIYEKVSMSVRYYEIINQDGYKFPSILLFNEVSFVQRPADPNARVIGWGYSELSMLEFIANEYNARVWWIR